MASAIQTTSGYVTVVGGQLYYDEAGSGQTLVLIPAQVADLHIWDSQVPSFSQNYRVIRYDLRGHGLSKTEPVNFSQVSDLNDLLRQLDVEKAVLLTLGLSASIALDYALAHPDMVGALVLVSPEAPGVEPPASEAEKKQLTAIVQAQQAQDVERLAELETTLWLSGAEPTEPKAQPEPAQRDLLREMIARDYMRRTHSAKPHPPTPASAERLSKIRVPTLVVVGDLDTERVKETAHTICHAIPFARRTVFPQTARAVNVARPNEFNRVVLDFLAHAPKQ